MESKQKVVTNEKSIGFVGAFSIVFGCIIGSGIFITVGDTMKASPPSVGMLIIFWLIGGIISFAGGMCYAELASMVTKSGGESSYLSEAFGKVWGIAFTYSYVFIVKTITFAALGITFGRYMIEAVLPNCVGTEVPTRLVAAVAILIAFIINCISNNVAAKTQIFFAFCKMASLGMIVITGFVNMAQSDNAELKKPFRMDYFDVFFLGSVFINVLWSYEGWNTPGAIVGDMKNPKRDLPLAITVGVGSVILLYSATIISYISVLGYNVVQQVDTVAILFANKKYGKFSAIIPVFICCSAYGALHGGLFSVARVLLSSGYEGNVPKLFSLVHRKSRTPVTALFFITIFSLCFIASDLVTLISYCAFVTWMFYFLVMCALIHMKFRRKDLEHSFKVPVILPIFIQLVSVFMVVMAFIANWIGCTIILSIVVIIFAIHWLPDRILKPKPLVRAHDRLCGLICSMFNLTPADKSDVS